jgi:hypothetical protein
VCIVTVTMLFNSVVFTPRHRPPLTKIGPYSAYTSIKSGQSRRIPDDA